MADTARAWRYAVYFAPAAGGAGWQAGSRWLGRCAATGAALAQPRVPGIAPDVFARATAEPRRYGWHATLKPPFRLAEGASDPALRAALQALSAELPATPLPPWRVRWLDGFLALCPDGDAAWAHALAAACVQRLHAFAAPLTPQEQDRRRAQRRLTPAQEALLQAWGYPWVLEEFRLHFSLTGRLEGAPQALRDALEAAARAHFEGLGPCVIDRLSLFAEPAPGADFRLVEQWVLHA
ncbi:DUF1045 domain-containing protein [Paracidovorax anthurii]|uniref:Uncharacterized protein DUF1045 n=1 Tax=Paracidovorax anthurii TaxID=78229 RepID=A0A328ZIS3_9BURK|nr:DUF1045 domain-containing protein [Paracidovorax anthurii]RAR85484.1 uncharacterized protein DUF1045 [Paracidovorax anthurii]